MTSNNQWFIKNSYRYSSTRTVFSQLCQHDDFMTEVEKVWKEKFVPALSIVTGNTEGTGRLKSMQYNYNLTLPSSVMNYTIWDVSDNLLVPEAGTTHSSQFNYLVNFVNGRITFMNSGLLDTETAKQQAIAAIDNLINQYSSEYSSDVIAEMNAVAKKAKSDIEKAASTSQVNAILEKAINDINACKKDVIYYDNSQTKWNEVYIYGWGGSLTAQWPGVKMKYEGSNIYSYTIEDGIENIIFSNGKGEDTGDKRQTDDLTFQGNKTIYTAYAEGAVYDSFKKAYVHSGSWSEYAPSDQVVYGDVNGDKKITSADAVLMARSEMGYITLTDRQAKAADVNGDGVVTVADMVLVQRYALGYIDKFPVQAA